MQLPQRSSFFQLALTLSTAVVCATEIRSSIGLNIQAAYHVIYSYSGVNPPSQLLNLTQQGLVGGIILFKDNVGDNLEDVIEEFQSAYLQSPGNCGYPLLIMTDQEGGEVRRVAGGPNLSEKMVGESSDPSQAASQAGTQAASALENYTINTNLAPVLGVYRQAGDFLDQYQRSYGNNSQLVGECASSFVSKQQSLGVIATAKHFPGLGAASASQNTDVEPVTINLSLDELRSVDEVPYGYAISAGVQMVMASWALYPALDATFPSGLSKSWIQSELRERVGFQGVTITDAIEAGALQAFGSDGNRAVLASQAGMDLILAASQNATQGETVVNAIVAALNVGTLSTSSFNESTQRIINLRSFLA